MLQLIRDLNKLPRRGLSVSNGCYTWTWSRVTGIHQPAEAGKMSSSTLTTAKVLPMEGLTQPNDKLVGITQPKHA